MFGSHGEADVSRNPATPRPRNSSRQHQFHTDQYTFIDASAGSGAGGCPFWGLRSSSADHSSVKLTTKIAVKLHAGGSRRPGAWLTTLQISMGTRHALSDTLINVLAPDTLLRRLISTLITKVRHGVILGTLLIPIGLFVFTFLGGGGAQCLKPRFLLNK
eukprot:1161022-Pelagomonas_calceolata.AAC.7